MSNQESQEVYKAVGEALKNARANGFDFKDQTDEQVADDMMMCDYEIEIMPRDLVVAAVKLHRS